LGEESSRYWHVIVNKTFQFDRLAQIAEFVKVLRKSRVLQFFDKYVAANGPCRHKLCIQVVAKQHEEVVAQKEENPVDGLSHESVVRIITNPADWQRSMPLFAMLSKVDVPVVDQGIQKE